jgi:transcription antitermination protein NusB
MAEESGEEPAAPSTPRARARGRRLGRTLAFKTLYEMDVSRHRPGEVLQRLVDDEKADPSAAEFARELLTGVLRQRADLDELIQESAPAYPLSQMSPVERNILRIGIHESLYTSQQVPMRVAINEAVELAKRFGSDSSPRFVNGVLGHLVRRQGLTEDEPSSASP